MADAKISANTDAAPLDGNELIPCTDDPSGTPVDGYFTPADLATYLGSGTVITGLGLQWDATDGITVKTGQCYTESGDNISASSAIAKASLSLSSSTWYHVYVYLSGGSPAAEVVTTAPTAWTGTAYSKTGDTSRRYVGSIRTDGSGNIYNFIHIGNEVQYQVAINASPFRVASNQKATSETAVDCSSIVPITSKRIWAKVANVDGSISCYLGNSLASVAPPGDGLFILAAGLNLAISLPVDTSQEFTYAYPSTPTTGFYADVFGYYFDR